MNEPYDNKQDTSCQIVQGLLQKARRYGATAAKVVLDKASGYRVNVRLGKLETLEYQDDCSLVLTVYRGQHAGTVGGSDLSDDALTLMLDKACEIAQLTQADSCAGLAASEAMAFDYPSLDLCYPWPLTPVQAKDMAQTCESLARDYDKRIVNSEGVSISTLEGFKVYGNTHGFIGYYQKTRHSMSCSLIAKQGTSMQRDGDYTIGLQPNQLLAPDTLAKSAGKRVVDRLNARDLASQRCPVIFDASIAHQLFDCLLQAIRGEHLYKHASWLLNSLNKPVLPAWMTLIEQPHLIGALGSLPFDLEGVAISDKYIVKDGILCSYLLNSYTARQLGIDTIGYAGGIRTLTVNSNQRSVADLNALLLKMDRGLLITELLGNGVSIVTGDYSQGAFGYWVEHGRIQYPVHQITIAGNLRDMLKRIAYVSQDIDLRHSVRVGAVLIEEMAVAGQL